MERQLLQSHVPPFVKLCSPITPVGSAIGNRNFLWDHTYANLDESHKICFENGVVPNFESLHTSNLVGQNFSIEKSEPQDPIYSNANVSHNIYHQPVCESKLEYAETADVSGGLTVETIKAQDEYSLSGSRPSENHLVCVDFENSTLTDIGPVDVPQTSAAAQKKFRSLQSRINQSAHPERDQYWKESAVLHHASNTSIMFTQQITIKSEPIETLEEEPLQEALRNQEDTQKKLSSASPAQISSTDRNIIVIGNSQSAGIPPSSSYLSSVSDENLQEGELRSILRNTGVTVKKEQNCNDYPDARDYRPSGGQSFTSSEDEDDEPLLPEGLIRVPAGLHVTENDVFPLKIEEKLDEEKHEINQGTIEEPQSGATDRARRRSHEKRPRERRHECCVCGRAFHKLNVLEIHLRLHTGEKPYACPLGGCQYRARQKQTVYYHVRTTHLNIRPFPCPHEGCEYRAILRQHLQQHEGLVHGGPRPFSCHYEGCDYKGVLRSALEMHLRSHTGEKPFVCEWPGCRFRTARKDHLSRHLAFTHEKVRGYPCPAPDCAYAASRKEHLERHVRSLHTPADPTGEESADRPFPCPHARCDFRTARKDSLANHVRARHRAAKLFRCPYTELCDYAAATKSGLNYHMKARHQRAARPLRCPWEGCTYRSTLQDNLDTHVALEHERRRSARKRKRRCAEKNAVGGCTCCS